MRKYIQRHTQLIQLIPIFFAFPYTLYGLDFRDFLPPRPLIFDVGANIGEKTEIYLELGAREVISIEPNEIALEFLYKAFSSDKRVVILPIGLSHISGKIPFYPAKNPALSSATLDWKMGRFKDEIWEAETSINASTLDNLIHQYGVPDFCKIDVEGYEFNVLQGLSQPIPLISFEFAYEFLDSKSKDCFMKLRELGYDCFNVALGGTDAFVFDHWMDRKTIHEYLLAMTDDHAWGDIYALYTSSDMEEISNTSSK
jgi:FkbM family methyltransferase